MTATVGLFTAAVHRRQGHLATSIAAYKHAEAIDPRNRVVLYDASQTYFGLRDWQTAAERMDRVLALAPDALNVKIQRGYIEFYRTGSTAAIKAALDRIPPNIDPDGVVTFARWDVAMMDRDTTGRKKRWRRAGWKQSPHRLVSPSEDLSASLRRSCS